MRQPDGWDVQLEWSGALPVRIWVRTVLGALLCGGLVFLVLSHAQW